jgi:hypothetical protein
VALVVIFSDLAVRILEVTILFHRTGRMKKVGRALVLFLVVCTTFSSQTMVAKFKAITSSNGSTLCAVDLPNKVVFLPRGSYIQCGLMCMNQLSCKVFNFNSPLGRCDMYSMLPRNTANRLGCIGYVVRGMPKAWRVLPL